MTKAIILGGSRGIGKAIADSLKSIEIDVFPTEVGPTIVNIFFILLMEIRLWFELSSMLLITHGVLACILQNSILHFNKIFMGREKFGTYNG